MVFNKRAYLILGVLFLISMVVMLSMKSFFDDAESEAEKVVNSKCILRNLAFGLNDFFSEEGFYPDESDFVSSYFQLTGAPTFGCGGRVQVDDINIYTSGGNKIIYKKILTSKVLIGLERLQPDSFVLKEGKLTKLSKNQ